MREAPDASLARRRARRSLRDWLVEAIRRLFPHARSSETFGGHDHRRESGNRNLPFGHILPGRAFGLSVEPWVLLKDEKCRCNGIVVAMWSLSQYIQPRKTN